MLGSGEPSRYEPVRSLSSMKPSLPPSNRPHSFVSACCLLALAAVLAGCRQAGPDAAAEPGGLDAGRFSIRSVDPFHALVQADAGAVSTSHVFFMWGEPSEPKPAQGTYEEAAGDGSLRFVLDLQPGGSISLWTASSDSAAADGMTGPIVLTSDPAALPAPKDGGTAEQTPGLDGEMTTLTMLDGHHALLEGVPARPPANRCFSPTVPRPPSSRRNRRSADCRRTVHSSRWWTFFPAAKSPCGRSRPGMRRNRCCSKRPIDGR